MDDEEYREIQEAAEAARLTVSAWVRQTLRAARERGPVAPGPPGPRTSDPVAAPAPAGFSPASTDAAAHPLAREVMERFGLSSPGEALEFALRRATAAPLFRSDLLELRGSGWSGDPGTLRARPSRPQARPPSDPPGAS
jgi:Arc/MetJ family transcription regulator